MSGKFSVLTYNILKLSGPATRESVLKRVLALEPRPDIIGFQEVFSTGLGRFLRNARGFLEESLRSRGFETFWSPASGFRLLASDCFRDGLLLATRQDRWAIDGSGGRMAETLEDGVVMRRVIQGVLLRERMSDGSVIAFFNTHLSAGTGRRVARRRRQQIARAIDFIERIEAEHRPLATILVGDLNAELNQLGDVLPQRKGLRFIDTWRAATSQKLESVTMDRHNTLVQSRLFGRGKRLKNARIDHVLLRPDPEDAQPPLIRPTKSDIVLKERVAQRTGAQTGPHNLSDHYGVLTEFEIVR